MLRDSPDARGALPGARGDVDLADELLDVHPPLRLEWVVAFEVTSTLRLRTASAARTTWDAPDDWRRSGAAPPRTFGQETPPRRELNLAGRQLIELLLRLAYP